MKEYKVTIYRTAVPIHEALGGGTIYAARVKGTRPDGTEAFDMILFHDRDKRQFTDRFAFIVTDKDANWYGSDGKEVEVHD